MKRNQLDQQSKAFWKKTLKILLPVSFLCAALGLTAVSAGAQSVPVGETYRVAYDVGFQEGRAAGLDDKANGRLFDLANKKDFQRAEKGFEPAVHDREVYVVAYRRGFEDGYEEGYGLTEAAEVRTVSSSSPAPSAYPEPPVPVTRRVDIPQRIPVSSPRIVPGIRIEVELRNTLSTRYSERGDPFRGQVIRDVVWNDQVLIPRGSEIKGEVAYVKRAGRIRGRAQLNLRFDSLHLPDGRRASIQARVVGIERRSAETVRKSGEEGTVIAPGTKGEDAKSVGKASGVGALLGVLTGGKSGAAVGATAGAVAGLAGVLMTRGQDAVLETGTELTIELTDEVEIPERP